MRQRKTTALVIVDEDHSLLGIVSAYELLKGMSSIKTIEEIMQSPQSVLFDSATAKDAIINMEEAPFGIIPVINESRKVKGLVTRGTLLSALSSQWTEMEVIMKNLNIWEQFIQQGQMRCMRS